MLLATSSPDTAKSLKMSDGKSKKRARILKLLGIRQPESPGRRPLEDVDADHEQRYLRTNEYLQDHRTNITSHELLYTWVRWWP